MTDASTILFAPLAFLAGTSLYYLVLTRVADSFVMQLWLRRKAVSRASVEDLFAVVNIGVAAVFQIVVVAGLIALLDIPILSLLVEGADLWWLLLVLPLAVAELSLASMLAGVALAFTPEMQSGGWRLMMDAGWLRSFLKMGANGRHGTAPVILLVYIAAEEILFRGVGIWCLASLPAVAITMTSLVFVAVQCVGMPSWRHAIFPVAGAVVMGPTHAWLVLSGAPLLFPIAVHLTFFIAAVATAPHLDRQRDNPEFLP